MEECLENLVVSMMSFFDGGKNESQKLTDSGVPVERIRKYGFAFEGKNVKIGG